MNNTYLFQNGTIYDGLGGDGYMESILIQNGMNLKVRAYMNTKFIVN